MRAGEMSGRVPASLATALLAAALAAAVAGCGGAEAREAGRRAGEADAPIPVRVAEVTLASGAQAVAATGVLGAREEIPLAFKVGGIVARVLVHEGEAVRAGQPLAELEPAEIDARVRQAEAGAEKAERDLARVRNLQRDSVATLEQLQNAASAADVARADLAVARFNRRYATVTAPADGTVLRRMVEPGQLVAPGSPVLVVSGRGLGTRLRVGVADRDVVRIRRGDAATVRFDAYPGQEFPAHVSEVGAAAQPQTGTYEVELAVDDARAGGRALPVGLIGHATIQPSAGEGVRVVPVEAIAEADGSAGSVYTVVADGQTARRLAVEIAYIDGNRVGVRRGLEGVRRVVTAGVAYLEDGEKVRVVP